MSNTKQLTRDELYEQYGATFKTRMQAAISAALAQQAAQAPCGTVTAYEDSTGQHYQFTPSAEWAGARRFDVFEAPQPFDRARETSRRQSAVELLLSIGYVWNDGKWQVQHTEPFGYFRSEPFGWTNCAETDDGAIALYEAPPAQAAQSDGRGTDAQIEKERDIARHAIVGSLAAGYAGQVHPGADHWLAAAHEAGARIKELEDQAAQGAGEVVGEVGIMPGTTGFTMACFRADEAPVGAKLYTHPTPAQPAPVVPEALTHGAWYWVRYAGLDQTFEAPALFKSSADAFYSYEFSGIPTRNVEVLGLAATPTPPAPPAQQGEKA